MNVSYSSLQTYSDCPLRFKYAYRDKVPSPQSISTIRGVVLHAVFENAVQGSYESVKEAVRHFRKVIIEQLLVRDGVTKKQIDEVATSGKDAIEWFWSDVLPQVVDCESTELPFSFAVETDDGEIHRVRGFIDRVDRKGDLCTIIDYKTGQDAPTPEMLPANLQLGIYAYAMMQKAPLLPPEKCIVGIINPSLQVNVQAEITKEDIAQVPMRITRVIEDIRTADKANVFPANKGAHCRHCPYTHLCPLFNSD